MFGTSGIRGIYGKDVTVNLALKIGNVFAQNSKNIVIGRDTRQTGKSLEEALISGITSSGCNVIKVGIVPTPTLALLTKKLNCKGIMITASHNPNEYNGLKLIENGIEISRESEKEITNKYKSNNLVYTKWDKLGKIDEYKDAINDHKNLIKSLINSKLIKSKKPKVVVDSNSPASLITPLILKELGCEVISINDSLNGFSRKSEPSDKNLEKLKKKVKEENADLGIAHDGDADRCTIVDENGEFVPLDSSLAIMIESELKNSKSKKIISTVEASLMIRELVDNFGAKLKITPVGSLYIAENIRDTDAIFGGEPCGEYLYEKGVLVPDGILSAVKFVEIFCKYGKFSLLKNEYKNYPMIRDKFKCDGSKKYKLVEKIKEKFLSEMKESLDKNQLRDDDGFRVDESNGWFLIRASGTEPMIRLTMEYRSKEELNSKHKLLSNLITNCL